MHDTWFKLPTYLVLTAIALSLSWSIINLGRQGHWYTGLLLIVVSPFSMWVIRKTMEGDKPDGLLNPSTQSWAFLFGDAFLLPLAMTAIAMYWLWTTPLTSRTMMVLSLTFGVLVALLYRYGEYKGYTASGDAELLNSPTKLWHDLVVYPVFVSSLIYLGVPLVIGGEWSGLGLVLKVLAIVPIIIWLIFALGHDRHLDPRNLHPPVSKTILR